MLTRNFVFACVRSNRTSLLISSARNLASDIPVGRAKYNFKSKVALVTASTDGIGYEIARRLAQSDANVIISSRKQSNVDKALKQLHDEGLTSVVGQVCHVGKAEDCKNLVKFVVDKYKGVDIFVSNAAANPAIGQVLDSEDWAFDKIMEINVKAAYTMTKEIWPHMENRSGDRSIIYISSIAGYQLMPLLSAYSISKTALLGLSRAVAFNCSGQGVRVNCVCPGVIKTRFSEAVWKSPQFTEEFERTVLIKRMGESSEVANLVTFLASEEASYITGESYAVAGGFFTRL